MARVTITMAAGEFKSKCLKIMDEVCEKKISITLTKHGKPVAKLVPIVEEKMKPSFGCGKGTLHIHHKDIIGPFEEEWEAEK